MAGLVVLGWVSSACSGDASDSPAAAPTTAVAGPSASTAGSGSAPASTAPGSTDLAAPRLGDDVFTVQPGTEQVAVLGGTPGAEVAVVRNGEVVASGTIDEQGGLLFRALVPGPGYALRTDEGETEPFEIADPADHPDADFYADQPLLPPGGFGYIATRDGTTLSANVLLPGPADAGPVSRQRSFQLSLRSLPGFSSPLQFFRRHPQFQFFLFQIDLDDIVVFHQRQRPAFPGFRADMADARPSRRAGKTTVGHHRHRSVQPHADQHRGWNR